MDTCEAVGAKVIALIGTNMRHADGSYHGGVEIGAPADGGADGGARHYRHDTRLVILPQFPRIVETDVR